MDEAPIADEPATFAEGESDSEIEDPTADTQADSQVTSAEPVEKAPLSRRARKLHQKRLREAARREAGK